MIPYETSQSTPLFVYDGKGLTDLDKQIKDIQDEFRVKEVDLTFKEERLAFSTIKASADAYKFVKDVIYEGIEIQEHFIVLYMNHANKIIGYYKHSKGTVNSTQVDIEMVVAVALKMLAKKIIISEIERMSKEHEFAGGAMDKINTLTSNYRVPEDACNTYNVSFKLLHQFEDKPVQISA
jgi:hypothetical protein